MIVENHAKGKIFWPNKQRVAVAITFDFQGGEPVRPGPNGKLNNEDYAEGEYGPKTGIWRILRMLEEADVKNHVSHLRRHRRTISQCDESDHRARP